jgi:cell wall assembly regulator SMI1
MHEYWIPFASYTAEVTFLIDFDPGPSGKRGQVLVNYGFEDRVVICDSLTQLFSMVNQALRDRTLKFGPVKGYEQKYDLLTASGRMARLDQLLGNLRG